MSDVNDALNIFDVTGRRWVLNQGTKAIGVGELSRGVSHHNFKTEVLCASLNYRNSLRVDISINEVDVRLVLASNPLTHAHCFSGSSRFVQH